MSDSFYFLCKWIYGLLRVMVYYQIAIAEFQTILNLWDLKWQPFIIVSYYSADSIDFGWTYACVCSQLPDWLQAG